MSAAWMLAVAIATALVARRVRRVIAQRRRRRTIRREVPDGIELLVLLLHAGDAPVTAARRLATVGPPALRDGWGAVIHQVERNRPLAEAIGVLTDHHGPDMAPVVAQIASAERYGTPLAPVLERLAVEIRATRRRAAEAEARSLSVSMSFPLVICTLPSFVLLGVVPALAGTLSSLRDLAP